TSKLCGSAGGCCTRLEWGRKENFSKQPSSFHIVTSLPIWRRQSPMASVQPSASPSGRMCDITTKRCFSRSKSAIWESEVLAVIGCFGPRSWRLGRQTKLVEDLQDAVSTLAAGIQLEVELRRPLEHHAL